MNDKLKLLLKIFLGVVLYVLWHILLCTNLKLWLVLAIIMVTFAIYDLINMFKED